MFNEISQTEQHFDRLNMPLSNAAESLKSIRTSVPLVNALSENSLPQTQIINDQNNFITINRFKNVSENDLEAYSTVNTVNTQNEIVKNITFEEQLKHWALRNNITHRALNELIVILKPNYSCLKNNARSLLRTPKKSKTVKLSSGEMVYFGIEKGVNFFLC